MSNVSHLLDKFANPYSGDVAGKSMIFTVSQPKRTSTKTRPKLRQGFAKDSHVPWKGSLAPRKRNVARRYNVKAAFAGIAKDDPAVIVVTAISARIERNVFAWECINIVREARPAVRQTFVRVMLQGSMPQGKRAMTRFVCRDP